jgi:uncharacterized cupredoxin-like copper-binding protein
MTPRRHDPRQGVGRWSALTGALVASLRVAALDLDRAGDMGPRNMTRRAGMVVSVAALAALLVACGGGSTATQPATTQRQDVTITARDMGFSATSLRLKAGQPVRLTFVNSGALEHDVTIPGLNESDAIIEPLDHDSGMTHMMDDMARGTVHMAASAGGSAMVEFTPKAGSYEFYCSVAGHREAGMSGTLVVQ